MPGSRPPTESKAQVQNSSLLGKVNPRRSVLFFDGNRAWAGESARMGLEYRQVSHQDHAYAKRVADTPGSLSNWGGTQVMDRWWLSLKRFIPASLNRKKKNSSFSGLHPHIPLLLFQWAWRTHVLRGKSPAEILHLLSKLF